MSVTRWKRKEQRNFNTVWNRREAIKHLTALPTIKNVDIESIKAEFAAKKQASA